ncbi:MAG: hypothetical protein CMG60_04820 [Candidatus Marinimicrobia bacterium]|nr:hypothetical protein [Candidatus Neomarinimicrobiota bacterium]|tara:strand:+ start:1763 stop:2578 length:816 start_codon:yes stop_codon:yes gene_type:complete
MSISSEKNKIYHYNNPNEPFPGLTIDDLNRYLPAIQTVEDMAMLDGIIKEGVFLTKCIDGLKKIPDQSIDLIIASPPKNSWDLNSDNSMGETLQEYYQWNQLWISESHRVLQKTGSIYIITPWEYSGMYQGLLSNQFHIQSRITWRDKNKTKNSKTWVDQASDIWFATKTEEFLFKQNPVGINTIESSENIGEESNIWLDLPRFEESVGRYPLKLISRILNASSFKLNWVLDPFMGFGDVGVSCKQNGRRFIGFETNKDYLLLSMKRIDKG